MSDQLKVGDRVRYRAEMVEQGFLHPRKLELTGKILRLPQGKKKCYLVKWNDVADSENTVHGSWLEPVPPSGRTFAEVVKELGEKYKKEGWTVNLYQGYILMLRLHSEITIFDNGGIDISGLRATPAELEAISAACSEIAANYEAEHGKEDA